MASEPFIGEIMIFGFDFPPRGYASCSGQLLSISSNTALFSILGTTYGGDGRVTFGLPDLRGRAANGQGQGPGLSPKTLGEVSGQENVTLISTQMASHNHIVSCNNGDGDKSTPVGNVFAGPGADRDLYWYNNGNTGSPATMAPNALGNTGGNQPHNNMMPYLAVNFCIALQGVFPARN
jgi:microcystin-dependent protein